MLREGLRFYLAYEVKITTASINCTHFPLIFHFPSFTFIPKFTESFQEHNLHLTASPNFPALTNKIYLTGRWGLGISSKAKEFCFGLYPKQKTSEEEPIMYKTFIFLASFVVVLTLVGSVTTGEIVFLDDFEDGSATDGAPVTWSPVPGYNGSFDVIDGDYVLTRPTNREEMYCYVNQYMTLADVSIRTQARLIPGGWWFGIGARGNVGVGTYIALLKNNERLEIWRLGASAHVGSMLASADVGIDPRAQDVLLRFDVIGNELSAWAWREGDPMPAEPQVTAVHSELATGEVIVAADLGWRLSNNEAIFRYVEVYEPTPPTPDFNGDGLVDVKDLMRLIQSWGQDDPTVDIAPPPFGDGIVDVLDLELLMSYWGTY